MVALSFNVGLLIFIPHLLAVIQKEASKLHITLNERKTFFSAFTYSEAKCTKQVFSFAEKWQRHKIADCNGVQWREYVQGAIN